MWDPYIDQKKVLELKSAQAKAIVAESAAKVAEAARDSMPILTDAAIGSLLTQQASTLEQLVEVKTAVFHEVDDLKQSKEQMASELRRREEDLKQASRFNR